MEATVIQFPEVEVEKLSCLDCRNVYMGTLGLFCGAHKEEIVFDDVAEECNEYETF